MGRDKALLHLGPVPFVVHLAQVLHGEVSPLLIVLGHHASEIESQVQKQLAPLSARLLRNPDYRQGQLSSLQAALRALESEPVGGVVVCLVDTPAISKQVVRTLLRRFHKSSAPVLIPTHRGRRGHPVIFSQSVFAELLEAPPQEGARFVVRRHAEDAEYVEVDDEGVVLDIDRPEDYQALQKRSDLLNAAGGKPPRELS